MFSGDQLESKVIDIAASVFGSDLPAYLISANNRILLGIQSDRSKRLYAPLFGRVPEELIHEANRRFVDAMCGYRVNIADALPVRPNADVFIIDTELLQESDEAGMDSLILHELCHWALDGRPEYPDSTASRFKGYIPWR